MTVQDLIDELSKFDKAKVIKGFDVALEGLRLHGSGGEHWCGECKKTWSCGNASCHAKRTFVCYSCYLKVTHGTGMVEP